MPDMEKVINHFDDALSSIKPVDWWVFVRKDFLSDAVAMLKEQEAVEPKPVHNSFRWFACGKCDCSITREDRFCPRCGKAVKWDGYFQNGNNHHANSGLVLH